MAWLQPLTESINLGEEGVAHSVISLMGSRRALSTVMTSTT